MKRTSDSLGNIGLIEHIQARLRDSTRASHRVIDHHPLLAPLVKPTLTLDHYKYVLNIMSWMHLHLKDRLSESISEYIGESQFVPGDRLEWLASDFKYLNMPATSAPEYVVKGFKPRLDSPEALVGTLYVIEGSSLGGQFIAQQLAKSIQVYPGQGASFFHGHGEDTYLRWNDYWMFAGSVCKVASLDEVCAAADFMFEQFENMLNASVYAQPHSVTAC